MLERFKPLPHQVVRVSADSLYDSVEGVFLHMGTTKEDAAEGANTLTMTDLRGVETHGVSNMLRNYVKAFRTGQRSFKYAQGLCRELYKWTFKPSP